MFLYYETSIASAPTVASPLAGAATSSRLISGAICACGCARTTSQRVALAEHEQALVLEHGQRALRVRIAEPDEAEHERVEHLVTLIQT